MPVPLQISVGFASEEWGSGFDPRVHIVKSTHLVGLILTWLWGQIIPLTQAHKLYRLYHFHQHSTIFRVSSKIKESGKGTRDVVSVEMSWSRDGLETY